MPGRRLVDAGRLATLIWMSQLSMHSALPNGDGPRGARTVSSQSPASRDRRTRNGPTPTKQACPGLAVIRRAPRGRGATPPPQRHRSIKRDDAHRQAPRSARLGMPPKVKTGVEATCPLRQVQGRREEAPGLGRGAGQVDLSFSNSALDGGGGASCRPVSGAVLRSLLSATLYQALRHAADTAQFGPRPVGRGCPIGAGRHSVAVRRGLLRLLRLVRPPSRRTRSCTASWSWRWSLID